MNIEVKFNYLFNERLKENWFIGKSGSKQRLFDYSATPHTRIQLLEPRDTRFLSGL